MTEKLPEHYDPSRVEQYAKERWNEVDALERANDREGDPFYFVDGPPFTSGRMHCGNAWGKVLKDALLRYHRMDGRPVVARPGYDTHGLPVEVRVEQDHDFDAKQEVEEYGVDRFVDECRAYVEEQQSVMDEEFADLGVWMDWSDPYRTMDPDYVETVWAAFRELHDQGLVERGRRVVNVCPRCETAVADARLEYDARTTTAAYVGFPLEDRPGRLVTWTTTPWTVVGNQFVAVDREAAYAVVEPVGSTRPRYVAADRVAETMAALGHDEYEVVETLPGEDLVGLTYRHPLAVRVPGLPSETGEVVHADYVDVEKTGLVHSAPGFGHEDYERGRDLDLPPFSPVDLDGRFTDDAGEYAGRHVHGEGTERVLDDLQTVGALLATEEYGHEYPRCPRCDTDVVYRAAEQFLVRVTEMREDLLDAMEDTTWYPAEARDTRFRNTVESAPDWNVSRQRYWGSPLPVWNCEDCDRDVVVGSTDELAEVADADESALNPADLSDPHRPAVDDVVVECPDCGGAAHRVEDVLDVWFDSAVASWATAGVAPPETPENWPADLVVEGQDQTRGWFLMQLYLGVAFADRAPYEEVVMHGFALLDGEPMSKSRDHVLRPPTVVEEHGRDALRALLLSQSQHERDLTMTSDMQGVAEMADRLDVVWNVYRFAMLYMAEDDRTPTPDLRADPTDRTRLDRWVLSRLDTVVETATQSFEHREPDRALSAVLDFLVDDVSRYYVKTVRDRVWVEGDDPGKAAAYDTLGTVLHASVRMLAPFVPHVAERLYEAVDGEAATVHATDWPTADAFPAAPALEDAVATLRDVESAVATARQRASRKKRWPVQSVVVECETPTVVREYADFLADRVNADVVRATTEYGDRRRVVDPVMEEFGPAFGAAAHDVADAVDGRPADDLPLTVAVDGETYDVRRTHVDVREVVPDGVEAVEFDGGAVYVDLELTEDLRKRGLVRDVTRRAQQLRQDLDLPLETRVALSVESEDPLVESAVEEYADVLREHVRVARFEGDGHAHVDEWRVDGRPVRVGLTPLAVPGQ